MTFSQSRLRHTPELEKQAKTASIGKTVGYLNHPVPRKDLSSVLLSLAAAQRLEPVNSITN